jgi:hypothetical protein
MFIRSREPLPTRLEGKWVSQHFDLDLRVSGPNLTGTLTFKAGAALSPGVTNHTAEIVGYADPNPLRDPKNPEHLHQALGFVAQVDIGDPKSGVHYVQSFTGQHHEEPNDASEIVLSWTKTAEEQPETGDIDELWYKTLIGFERFTRP